MLCLLHVSDKKNNQINRILKAIIIIFLNLKIKITCISNPGEYITFSYYNQTLDNL